MTVFETPRAGEFMALLQARVPESTRRHILSVTEFMADFAGALGVSPEQVAAAGLLHDLCKAVPGPELLTRAEAYKLDITPLQRQIPYLLHGPVAAEECRRELSVDDPEVLEAVACHTTGRPGLGMTGLALYLADFAEPLRAIPQAAEARAVLARDGFDAALRYATREKLNYVQAQSTVDPMTAAFAAWLDGAERIG